MTKKRKTQSQSQELAAHTAHLIKKEELITRTNATDFGALLPIVTCIFVCLCPSYGVCHKVPEPACVYFIFFSVPAPPLSQSWSVTKSQTQLMCTLSFFCSLSLCLSYVVCHKVPEPANVYFIFFLFAPPLSQLWSVLQSPRAS